MKVFEPLWAASSLANELWVHMNHVESQRPRKTKTWYLQDSLKLSSFIDITIHPQIWCFFLCRWVDLVELYNWTLLNISRIVRKMPSILDWKQSRIVYVLHLAIKWTLWALHPLCSCRMLNTQFSVRWLTNLHRGQSHFPFDFRSSCAYHIHYQSEVFSNSLYGHRVPPPSSQLWTIEPRIASKFWGCSLNFKNVEHILLLSILTFTLNYTPLKYGCPLKVG